MANLIKELLPYAALASHIIIVFLFLAVLCRKSWGKDVFAFLGKHGVVLGLVVSLVAVLGSLFYSEVIGYEPCSLCWWQRAFIFPQPLIFIYALKSKRNVWKLVVAMAVIAGAIALYQSYVSLGGASVLPCTAVGGECSRVYVKEFGYITIPMMSLTISLYVILLAWVSKIYKNENSNA